MSKKVTSASEYRKKSRMLVELPSGAVFEIRKLSPLVYGEALEQVGISPAEGAEQVDAVVRKNIFSLMKLIVPKCVISPKISVSPSSDDELDYEDIELADLTRLMDEIYKFSGLTVEAEQEREEFREEPAS